MEKALEAWVGTSRGGAIRAPLVASLDEREIEDRV